MKTGSEVRPTAEWRRAAGRGSFEIVDLARIIDHTILKAQAAPADVVKLCGEAVRHGFGAVCVNSVHVPLAAKKLAGTGVAVCAVVGFPLGAMASEAKAYEAGWVVRNGATEVDMVLAVGHLKGGDDLYVENDIRAVVEASRAAAVDARRAALANGADVPEAAVNPVVKVILECCYLSNEEKVRACRLAEAAGADYVKTSTGFATSGATAEDVALMRDVVRENLGVKAAGGIRDLRAALDMIAAGADRLGMSAGLTVLEEARSRSSPG